MRIHRQITNRRLARATLALALGGVLCVAVDRGHAQADTGFSAIGSAYAMRAILTIPTAPATPTPVDVGGPLAQAAMDSLGNRRGLAAFPYPGDIVLTGPGLVAGLLGTTPLPALPALPAYPFYVQTDNQKSKDSKDLPYGRLESSASPDAVVAHADMPATTDSPASMRALSTVTREPGGRVVVRALSSVTGLALGPLTVGSIASTTTMTLSPDGSVGRQSSLVARGLQIGGTSVDLTPDGLSVGGAPAPLPVRKAVQEALKGAGIDVELVPEQQTPTSLVTAAVQITRHQDFGPGGGNGSLTLILGQSSVTLSGAPLPAPPAAGHLPTLGVSPIASASAAGPSEGTPVAAAPPSVVSVPQSSAPPPAAHSPVSSHPSTGLSTSTRTVAERFDATPVYWTIVAAVLIAVATGPVLGHLVHRFRSAA